MGSEAVLPGMWAEQIHQVFCSSLAIHFYKQNDLNVEELVLALLCDEGLP